MLTAFDGVDPAEVFRTSQALVTEFEDGAVGARVQYEPAHGEKCARCWRILPEVTAPKCLCVRCDDAVSAWDSAKAAAE